MTDSSVRLDSEGLRQLIERAPEIVLEELSAGIVEATMLAEREIRERTPTSGAGTLRDSIGALPVEISGTAVRGGVGTSLSYAAPVETGARPHWMPLEPLVEWVERKLGLRGDEAKGAARAIRFKIAARGTQGAFMFRDGLKAVEPQILDILGRAVARAVVRVEAAE